MKYKTSNSERLHEFYQSLNIYLYLFICTTQCLTDLCDCRVEVVEGIVIEGYYDVRGEGEGAAHAVILVFNVDFPDEVGKSLVGFHHEHGNVYLAAKICVVIIQELSRIPEMSDFEKARDLIRDTDSYALMVHIIRQEDVSAVAHIRLEDIVIEGEAVVNKCEEQIIFLKSLLSFWAFHPVINRWNGDPHKVISNLFLQRFTLVFCFEW